MKCRIALSTILLAMLIVDGGQAQQPAQNVFHATIGEATAKTREVSTEELRQGLSAGEIFLVDTRPPLEWAIGHIPGAVNVAPTAGKAASQHTANVVEITRLLNGDRNRQIVLYCNGPFCGKSKRVAEELIAAGFLNVRRYQLGAPVWRALGGVMVIEPDALQHIYSKDQTAVWVDARDQQSFGNSTVKGARNVPHARLLENAANEITAAKDDGRLPMQDHNTRIIVFGAGGAEARVVAEAIARGAFHNVGYFEGPFEALRQAVTGKE